MFTVQYNHMTFDKELCEVPSVKFQEDPIV